MVATLVATSVISGVGAVPWLERSDSDGDGTEELGVEWNSLAGEAGAAASRAPGLSCPSGMVLDDGLCKTPKTETVPVTRVCPQAADGYVVVSAVDKLGESHSCQKTVPAHCTGGKVLHEGKCQTATVEHEPATWICVDGTLETSSGDHGVAHNCKIALDTPTCPTGETYRTAPSAGCYRDDSYYKKRGFDWGCSEGTYVRTSGDHGVSHSCRVTLNPPQCPAGETYRNSRCEIEEDYYKKRGFDWGCSEGTYVRTSGDHGVSHSCRVTLNPPQCPAGETYRNSRCEIEEDYYKKRGFDWGCSQGTYVRTSGDHGVSHSCRVTLNPPMCPDDEEYRTTPRKACYEEESYYDSAPLDYSCPATYTLRTSGLTRSCTKVEKYRQQVCRSDPFQVCWYENRTRTVTTAVIESCPSGYSPDGTGCTADTASTRWKRTRSTPTKYRYDPAVRSCPRGYTDNGTQCQSDTASTRWVRTGSTPTRYRYDPAVRSCPRGYTDNGVQCESDTASQRWVVTASTPAKHRYDPAVRSCPRGYTDNGTQCQADVLTPKWTPTTSTPKTHRYVPADPQCTTAGFEYASVASRCEKTAYTDPTEPLTKLVGRPPKPTCADGYTAAGAGRCERTVLGDPTQTPIGAECIEHLGTLGAGTVTRSGTLVAGTVPRSGMRASGCASLRKGDAQSPHWARRYTLYVPAASTATITASSAAADVYLYVLSGTDASLVVEDSDDDSGPGTDAEAAGVALAAGVLYTIEVTTSADRVTGAFTLTVTTVLDEPPVVITDLADAAVTGSGTLTARDKFTVEPAGAACTATAAGVTPSVAKTSTPGERTVSLTLAAPFSHDVTVVCDAPRRSPTSVVVTLAGRLPAVSVTGLEDSVPADGAIYASDKFTVSPADASCTGTAVGRGVGTPWVSSLSATRTVLARVWAGGAATVTVTCTAAGHSPGVAKAVFSAQPRPQIGTVTATFAPNDACTAAVADRADAAHSCTLAEGSSLTVTLTATADHATIAARWNTDSTVTATPGSVPAATPVIGPDNAATGHWQRTHTATLACTDDGAATAMVTAGRHPATDTHTTHVSIDCEQQVRISGLADAAGYSAPGTKATVTDAFTVEPATADCTAAPTGTITAPDTRRPHERLLSAQVTAGTTATVTVTCTNNDRADGTASAVLSGVAADCDDSLGSLVHGVTVARDGAVAADAGCTSAGRGLSGTFYARRHTFTLDAAARVSVDLAAASEAAPLDAYVVLYRGHDATAAAVLHSDDDSGPRSDSRLRNLRLGAGDYTIEATTATAQAVGGYRLGVRAVYSSPVRISGLADASGAGTGAVTVSEPFTVSPSTAACTAAPAAASVAAGSGRRRTVTATIDEPGSLPVTVTCTAAGRGPARQQATLTHAGALTTITARTASSGGECETARTRRGIDAAYRCRIGRGNTVTIAADAVATGPGIEIAWNTTGAITASGHQLGAATPTFGPDNSIAAWKRTATVDLACTSGGTATAKATLAGTTAKKTARLTVVCADAVQITGLEDASAEGTGTVTVTRGFTVTPPTAECSADPATAGVTEGVGGARTLSARVAVPATLETVVTCTADGYADAVRHVALTARRPCSTHLGTLATGTVTLSGTITKGQCAAKARRTATESVFYAQGRHWAKRHTFTLDTPGWVTISLDSAPANAKALDTYLVLLKDNNNTGTPIARNDNRTRRDKNAQLGDIFLQPGEYTIEATTKTPRTAGSYDLNIEAVESGLQDSYTATVGSPKTITVNYWPPDAEVAVSAAANEELRPSIATARTVTDGVVHGTATITLTPQLVHTHKDLRIRVRHNTATEQLLGPVALTAQLPCNDHLGALEPGSVTRTGTITADTACASANRSRGVRYARRHTFTLDAPGRVTVDLVGAGRLGTHLIVLRGHRVSGTTVASSSGLGNSSSLSGVHLRAGSYTIEATTKTPGAVGGYSLRVALATVNGISTAMHVVKGKPASFVFDYEPANATLAVAEDLLPAGVTAKLSHGGGSGTLTVTAANTGTYTGRLNVAIPSEGTDSSPTPGSVTVPFPVGGTVCATAIVIGQAVCAESSGYSLTVRKNSTVTIPDSCIQRVPPGRWYRRTLAWPTDAACVVPIKRADRRAQFFAFEVRDLTAEVTLRLSSDDQDTYLALFAANADPVVNGLNVVDLTRAHSDNNDVFENAAEDRMFRYRDGDTTDSRVQTRLGRGVYVVAATTATIAVPTATDRFTFNIKIPTSTCPVPPRDGAGA
ncbi:hypothetical protein [Candidatus Poriferisodalis sp.]|uniref:hypothetical protein n=1 Tax=Candidatus Poriferisodalis sp. TaxID=3101277 RepID=UPI003B0165A5